MAISEEQERYTELVEANRTFGFWAGLLTISSTILFYYSNEKLKAD
jgi:hypothetical protein